MLRRANIQVPDSSLQEDLFLFLKNNKSSPRSDSLKSKTWKSFRTGKDIEWSDEMVKLANAYLVQLDYFDRTIF